MKNGEWICGIVNIRVIIFTHIYDNYVPYNMSQQC